MVKSEGLADHFALEESVINHVPEAPQRMVKPIVRSAYSYQADTTIGTPTEKQECRDENHQEHKYL